MAAAAAAAEPGAPMEAEIDFEEESALLELASTQPDVKQEPGLEPGEWEQELSLLAMAQEQEQEPQEPHEPPWSEDEDRRLTALMLERRPTDSWTIIAAALGGDRSVASCSRRWAEIDGVLSSSIREGARRAALDFLKEAEGQEGTAAAGTEQDAPNLRVLSTNAVSVIPFEVPPDDFALLVTNLPREIDEEAVARMFEPFGALFETQVRAADNEPDGRAWAFVRFYCLNDARTACETLEGKFVRGRRLRIRKYVRGRSESREGSALAPERSLALLQRYLPLGFSTSILKLELAAEDRLAADDGLAAAAAAGGGSGSGEGAWHCRYTAMMALQIHHRQSAPGSNGAAPRSAALGSAEGEHTDLSRGAARTVAMKRAKRLALQACFSEVVLVLDHVEGAAVVLFDDEL